MENKIKKIFTVERLIYLSIIVFLFFYFKGIFVQTKQTVKNVEKAKQELIVDKKANNHFRKPFENNTSEIDKKEIDSLRKMLEGKNIEILAVTKMNASIRDTLKTFKMERDELNNKIWNFEKTYADGTKTKEKGQKKYFVDVTSQNKAFKLNGSEVLRIPVKEPKDLFQLNWGSAYYGGIGNQNNFATSELKMWILPDNVVVPNIGTGLIWFLNDGKVYPYYKIGVDIRLKSVQK